MVLLKIAQFADAPCIARSIGMRAISAHFASAYAMVTFMTLTFRVEGLVLVLAVRYFLIALLLSQLLLLKLYFLLTLFEIYFRLFGAAIFNIIVAL